MCDYSSFSSIDKFPFPCTERSGAAMPAPRAPSIPRARAGSTGHCQGAASPPAAALRRYLVLAEDHWGPL